MNVVLYLMHVGGYLPFYVLHVYISMHGIYIHVYVLSLCCRCTDEAQEARTLGC